MTDRDEDADDLAAFRDRAHEPSDPLHKLDIPAPLRALRDPCLSPGKCDGQCTPCREWLVAVTAMAVALRWAHERAAIWGDELALINAAEALDREATDG